jgi:uncharacterized protein YbaR (Trm112 family)
VTLDTRLLAVLACPQDKGPLYYLGDSEADGLYNPRLRRRYLVRDGIPVMLIDEAVSVDDAGHEALMARIEAEHSFADLGVDVLHRPQHALAEVAALVAVAQLDGLARTGRCARRHCRTAHHTGLEKHVAFDGGVAATVQNLAADDVNDGTHGGILKTVGRVNGIGRKGSVGGRRGLNS